MAIANVNVVPMVREVVLPARAVLIDGQLIAAIVPAGDARVATCETVVDGQGGYLLPGLIDSHVHVETAAFAEAFAVKTGEIRFEDVLALYPAFGVTSVRVMSGAPDILAFRDRPSGQPVPRLVVASPMLSGTPPILPEPVTRLATTPDEGRSAVREFAKADYDLVKIRENLRDDVFRAVTEEARRLSLDVDGHVTRSAALKVVDLIAGQRGFAHLDEVARAMDGNDGRDRTAILQALKARGGYVSSTMVVLRNAADQIADYDRMAARAEMRYLHPLLVGAFWTRARNPYLKPGADRAFFLALLAETKSALKLMTERGVTVLAGTDALNPMIIPGVSLGEELGLMVEAGLTPFEALRTATVNPASVLPRLRNAGALAAGRDADAVLLSDNPLGGIAALRRPAGVMLRGRWFDRQALDRRLEDVARGYGR